MHKVGIVAATTVLATSLVSADTNKENINPQITQTQEKVKKSCDFHHECNILSTETHSKLANLGLSVDISSLQKGLKEGANINLDSSKFIAGPVVKGALPEDNKFILDSVNLPADIKDGIIEVNDIFDNSLEEVAKENNIPEEIFEQYLLRIESFKGSITKYSDYGKIFNDGALAPKIEKVDAEKYLLKEDLSNYKQVLNELFDTSELHIWSRKFSSVDDNGNNIFVNLTENELKQKKGGYKSLKRKYSKKIDEIKKFTKSGLYHEGGLKLVTDLFNAAIENNPIGEYNKESLRKSLQTAIATAEFLSINREKNIDIRYSEFLKIKGISASFIALYNQKLESAHNEGKTGLSAERKAYSKAKRSAYKRKRTNNILTKEEHKIIKTRFKNVNDLIKLNNTQVSNIAGYTEEYYNNELGKKASKLLSQLSEYLSVSIPDDSSNETLKLEMGNEQYSKKYSLPNESFIDALNLNDEQKELLKQSIKLSLNHLKNTAQKTAKDFLNEMDLDKENKDLDKENKDLDKRNTSVSKKELELANLKKRNAKIVSILKEYRYNKEQLSQNKEQLSQNKEQLSQNKEQLSQNKEQLSQNKEQSSQNQIMINFIYEVGEIFDNIKSVLLNVNKGNSETSLANIKLQLIEIEYKYSFLENDKNIINNPLYIKLINRIKEVKKILS